MSMAHKLKELTDKEESSSMIGAHRAGAPGAALWVVQGMDLEVAQWESPL